MPISLIDLHTITTRILRFASSCVTGALQSNKFAFSIACKTRCTSSSIKSDS